MGIVSTCIPSISYLFKRAVKSFSSSENNGLPVSDQSDDRYSGYNTSAGKQRHKINSITSEFIKLKDVSPSTTGMHRSETNTFDPSSNHTCDVAVYGNSITDLQRKSSSNHETNTEPPREIYV